MFKKLFVQLAVVLGLLFFTTQAHAVIMRADVPSSAYEAYGQQSQFQSVGWMGDLRTDGHVHADATGVYLGDGWVLTCAHVIRTITNASGFTEMQFGVGPNFLTDWQPDAVADAWYVHPDYSYEAGVGQTPDLALVHLTTPLSVSAAVLYSGTVQAGDAISMVGYGNPGTDSTGPLAYDGEKRGGTNIVNGYGGDNVDYSWYSPDYMFARFDDDLLGQTALECMGAQHDSGGGVFIEEGGQTYLTGLMTFYTGPGTPGLLLYSYTGIMDITPYTEWINETRGADVPEPGTLMLFASGSLAILPRLLRRRKMKDTA